MSQVRTDLRETRERAREMRFEATGPISATNVQKAIEQATTQPQGVSSTAVSAAQSPYAVQVTDTVLYVDTSAGPVTITLQAAAARNTVPLSIKDVSGNAAANNITINPIGGENIDGQSPWVIKTDFDSVKLNPRAGLGYTVAP